MKDKNIVNMQGFMIFLLIGLLVGGGFVYFYSPQEIPLEYFVVDGENFYSKDVSSVLESNRVLLNDVVVLEEDLELFKEEVADKNKDIEDLKGDKKDLDRKIEDLRELRDSDSFAHAFSRIEDEIVDEIETSCDSTTYDESLIDVDDFRFSKLSLFNFRDDDDFDGKWKDIEVEYNNTCKNVCDVTFEYDGGSVDVTRMNC